MKPLLGFALAAVLGVLALQKSHGEPKSPPKQLMQKKLEHSREVLAGLCLEDFTRIAQNAQALSRMTEEQWIQTESDQYRMHLKNFRFAASELERLAGEKNIEGASLAHLQMTWSCVDCHKHLRSRAR
jgi:hypothetical protein